MGSIANSENPSHEDQVTGRLMQELQDKMQWNNNHGRLNERSVEGGAAAAQDSKAVTEKL